MYVFLQCTYCVQKSLTVSCTLLCECGDRVKVDQSSFGAYLHAVMLRHHCSEYAVGSYTCHYGSSLLVKGQKWSKLPILTLSVHMPA